MNDEEVLSRDGMEMRKGEATVPLPLTCSVSQQSQVFCGREGGINNTRNIGRTSRSKERKKEANNRWVLEI